MGDYHNPIWYFLFTKRNFIEWWRLWRLPYPPRQRVLAMNRNDVFGLRFLEYFPKWCLSIAKQTISHQLVVFSSSSWIPKLSFCDCMEIVCVCAYCVLIVHQLYHNCCPCMDRKGSPYSNSTGKHFHNSQSILSSNSIPDNNILLTCSFRCSHLTNKSAFLASWCMKLKHGSGFELLNNLYIDNLKSRFHRFFCPLSRPRVLVTDQKLSDAYDILTLLEAGNISELEDGLWTTTGGQLAIKEH